MPDDFRLRMERGDIYRQRQAVLQELVNMGPEYLDRRDPTGERARRRAELIARRQQMERTGSALTAAMTPAPTVNPAQAAAARTDLERRTGVTVQTPAERALTMAMGAESSDPSSLRASAREQALPFETMEYQRRREAADQRRADAQRFLTTPIPGAEAPLAAMERQRVEANQDREGERAVQLAAQEARIRALKRVGEPTGDDRLKEAQATLAEAQARRAVEDINDPNSASRQVQAAEQAQASSGAAQAKTGIVPDEVAKSAESLLASLPASFGPGASLNRPEELDRAANDFLLNVVQPLEELAKSGDAQGAARVARMLANQPSLSPQPGWFRRRLMDTGAVDRFPNEIMPYIRTMNDFRTRLQRLASAK